MKIKNTAFTLIELLVVIVIIGILATISVATFQGYFEKARDAERKTSVSTIANIVKMVNASREEVDYSLTFAKTEIKNETNESWFFITQTTYALSSPSSNPSPPLWYIIKQDLTSTLTEAGYSLPESSNNYKYLYAFSADKNEFVVASCLEDRSDSIFVADGTLNGISSVSAGSELNTTGCYANFPTPITSLNNSTVW